MTNFNYLILEGFNSEVNKYAPINKRGYYQWNNDSKYTEYVWAGVGIDLKRKLKDLECEYLIQLEKEKIDPRHIKSCLLFYKIQKIKNQIKELS